MKEEENIFAVPSLNCYCVDGVNLYKKERQFKTILKMKTSHKQSPQCSLVSG